MAASPIRKAAHLLARWATSLPPKESPRTRVPMAERESDPLTALAQSSVRALGETELAGRIAVTWNPRLQTTAGTACTRRWLIEINPAIEAFGEAQVRRTVLHEAAHLVAHWRAGRRRIQTHGAEWRAACTELGIGGESAFHELPLRRRRVQRKYAYRCRHCAFTVYRVRPFGPYTACYKCCQRFTGGKYSAAYMFIKLGPDHPIPRVPPAK
jgi:SprT protein